MSFALQSFFLFFSVDQVFRLHLSAPALSIKTIAGFKAVLQRVAPEKRSALLLRHPKG
jgi:hypothetical protein